MYDSGNRLRDVFFFFVLTAVGLRRLDAPCSMFIVQNCFSQNWSEETQNICIYVLIESRRELESQRRQLREANQSARENTFVQ